MLVSYQRKMTPSSLRRCNFRNLLEELEEDDVGMGWEQAHSLL